MTSRPRTRTTVPTIGMAALLLMAVAVMGIAMGPTAAAQSDPAPVPATFYGEVTIDGEPAPAGTTITAVIDGEVRGSITTDDTGAYGGPTIDDDRLVVSGTQDDAGEEVTFQIAGQEVTTEPATVTWESATDTEVNIDTDDIELPASQFDVAINETASTTAVTAGEEATVAVDITNTGDEAGTTPVTFTREESVVGSDTVSLDPDTTTTVVFTTVLETAGEVPVTVATDDAEVTVTLEAEQATTGGGGGAQPPSDDSEAEFTISDLTPETATVTAGETVAIGATITNTGDSGANQEVEVRIDDQTVASESVTLRGDETTEVTFDSVSVPDEEGTVTHGVFTADDSQTGTLTIEPAATDADDGTDADAADEDGTDDDAADEDDAEPVDPAETDDSIPGFTGGVALLALLVSSGMLWYRQR